ncbi:MAG: GNAT family N-acetyltransferase [Chloroflexia bacterium]|nr:GNAT family N-acetyltransferase [Chloroflexia bacterium]
MENLKDKSFETLFETFKEAFVDYEMQLNKDELQRMLTRRGFAPELSFGAFDGNKMVAFTFNGVGEFNGKKTAYDTGTGTVEDYRGRGLATEIFLYSLPSLKEAGISQYLLEVLQHNTKAVSLYQKLGFEVTREFSYFVQKNEEVKVGPKQVNSSIEIKPIELSQITKLEDAFDFHPSWQNTFHSVFRIPDEFKAVGAFTQNQLVGYCVTEMKSGDVTQMAVDKNYRRMGIGTLLFKEIMALNQHHSVKVINTTVDCESVTGLMKSLAIPEVGKQFEMIKKL